MNILHMYPIAALGIQFKICQKYRLLVIKLPFIFIIWRGGGGFLFMFYTICSHCLMLGAKLIFVNTVTKTTFKDYDLRLTNH